MKLASIRKALTPIVTGAIGWAGLVIISPSAAITSGEWLVGGTFLATALGVYAVTNGPSSSEASLAERQTTALETLASPRLSIGTPPSEPPAAV